MILDYNLMFCLFSKQLLILVSSLNCHSHVLIESETSPGVTSTVFKGGGKTKQGEPPFFRFPSSGATSELVPPPKEGSNHCGWFHMMLEEMIVDTTKPRS